MNHADKKSRLDQWLCGIAVHCVALLDSYCKNTKYQSSKLKSDHTLYCVYCITYLLCRGMINIMVKFNIACLAV